MTSIALTDLAICGIDELPDHNRRSYTHVVSLIDPDWPDITAFETFDTHERIIFRCHDIIDPLPGMTPPGEELVRDVLEVGKNIWESSANGEEVRLLIHCRKGVSRSSAAMLSVLCQIYRDEPVKTLYDRLRLIRPQAWPNSVMVGFIDDQLGYQGALLEGLCPHYGLRLLANPRTGEWMTANGRGREVEMAVMPA